MPELPEVEIHARNLRTWLVGRTLTHIQVVDAKLTEVPGPLPLEETLTGRRATAVRRWAKYLLVDLEGGVTMVAHLRMTGRFVRDAYVAGPLPKPTRLILTLDTGERVRFEDFRRFGQVWVAPTAELDKLPELGHLGPDALEAPITAEKLATACRSTRRPIKVVLLDQALLGGLGNICAMELLFRAGLSPATPANQLTPEQVEGLAADIPRFLEWVIQAHSGRELIYLSEKGAENVFPIYRRGGQPCPRCATPIAYGTVGGRGTYWCPQCQPALAE